MSLVVIGLLDCSCISYLHSCLLKIFFMYLAYLTGLPCSKKVHKPIHELVKQGFRVRIRYVPVVEGFVPHI